MTTKKTPQKYLDKKKEKYQQKKEIKMNAYAIFMRMNRDPESLEGKPFYSEYKKIHEEGLKIYSLIKTIINKDIDYSKDPIKYNESFKDKIINYNFKLMMNYYKKQGLAKTMLFIKDTLTIND